MKEKFPHNREQNDETTSHIIKNFKTLLTRQHENLIQYLNLLVKEKKVIESEDMDKIAAYIELENKFNETITICNKTLTSWRKKYEKIVKKKLLAELERQYISLQELQEQAFRANKVNQALVKEKLAEMKKEIAALPVRSYKISSPYKKIGTPNFIDITS